MSLPPPWRLTSIWRSAAYSTSTSTASCWLVVERSVRLTMDEYEAAVRMRLDAAQLPRPLQVSALTNRELHLESPWKQFIFQPSPARRSDAR